MLHAAAMTAAAIGWDPFVRGIVIIVIFVLVLPGTVYLVLLTDVGARLGFLLIAAGMAGMMVILSLLWICLDSSADIGRPNSWHPEEIITGDYASQITVNSAKSLPINNLANGTKPPVKALKTKKWYWPIQSCNDTSWHKIDPTLLSDPESEADSVLANSTGVKYGPGITSPFSATTDYVYIDGFRKGQNSGCLFAWSRHKVYVPFARGADVVVLRVKPVLPSLTLSAAPPTAQANPTAPYTYVILERNLGSVREPQFLMLIGSGIIFGLLCYTLHVREKDIERRKEEAEGGGDGGRGGSGSGGAGSGGGAGQRQPVGAGV